MDKYTILGIHPGDGKQSADRQPVPGVPSGKIYARVRMFIGKDQIDENFDLPELPGPIPLELWQPVFEVLIKDTLEARVAELENPKFSNEPSVSKIHAEDHNTDQSIAKGKKDV